MRRLLQNDWSNEWGNSGYSYSYYGHGRHGRMGAIARKIRESEALFTQPDVLQGLRWGLEFAGIVMLILVLAVIILFFTGKLGVSIIRMIRMLLGAIISRMRKFLSGGGRKNINTDHHHKAPVVMPLDDVTAFHDSVGDHNHAHNTTYHDRGNRINLYDDEEDEKEL